LILPGPGTHQAQGALGIQKRYRVLVAQTVAVIDDKRRHAVGIQKVGDVKALGIRSPTAITPGKTSTPVLVACSGGGR